MAGAALPGKHFFLPFLHSLSPSLSSLHFFWMGWDLGRGRKGKGDRGRGRGKSRKSASNISCSPPLPSSPFPPSNLPSLVGFMPKALRPPWPPRGVKAGEAGTTRHRGRENGMGLGEGVLPPEWQKRVGARCLHVQCLEIQRIPPTENLLCVDHAYFLTNESFSQNL